MVKKLIFVFSLFLCLVANAQDFDMNFGGTPPMEEKADTSSIIENISYSDVRLSIPFSEFKSAVGQELKGKESFIFGLSFTAAGVAMATIPNIVYGKTERGEIFCESLTVTGCTFIGFGLIYDIIGLSDWWKSTKRLKNCLLKYTPNGIEIDF